MRNLRATHVRAFRDACHAYHLYLPLVEARRILEIANDLDDALAIAQAAEHQPLSTIESVRLLNRVRRIEDALATLTGDPSLSRESDAIAEFAEVTNQ